MEFVDSLHQVVQHLDQFNIELLLCVDLVLIREVFSLDLRHTRTCFQFQVTLRLDEHGALHRLDKYLNHVAEQRQVGKGGYSQFFISSGRSVSENLMPQPQETGSDGLEAREET